MNAFCVRTTNRIAPFGDPVADVRVGAESLAEAQKAALEEAGFHLLDEAPASGPVLLFSDRTWFTPAVLVSLREAGQGRLKIVDEGWIDWLDPMQDMETQGEYEIGISNDGVVAFSDLKPIVLDLKFHDLELDSPHPSMAHAYDRPFRVGPGMVQQIDHWSHIVRVNHLCLAARMETARQDWESAGFIGRFFRVLAILWRARSLNGWKIASALTERGRDVKVHPTAVVEFSVLGDGCDIGPHAVVRGSIIGAGAKIDAHSNVNASVVDEGAKVGRYGFLNLCTVYPGAFISSGDGFQASVFGRESFMAWGTTILDLSFGASIKVEKSGPGTERMDSGHYFLGAAIGHRAVLGQGVKVRFGASIPNGGMLVDAGVQLREWGSSNIDGPAVVVDGQAAPLKSQD